MIATKCVIVNLCLRKRGEKQGMKKWYNRPAMQDDFWTHDIALFDGVFSRYRNSPRPVRGKIHVSDEPYELMGKSEQDSRPIPTRRGRRTYIMLHPYVFEPILTLTVGLYKKPRQVADMGEAIGETLGTPKQEGVREVQIGNA